MGLHGLHSTGSPEAPTVEALFRVAVPVASQVLGLHELVAQADGQAVAGLDAHGGAKPAVHRGQCRALYLRALTMQRTPSRTTRHCVACHGTAALARCSMYMRLQRSAAICNVLSHVPSAPPLTQRSRPSCRCDRTS